MVKVASLAAAHAATHRSRGLPAGSGPTSGPERRRALAAWIPKWGCGDGLAPCPTSTIPPRLTPQGVCDAQVPAAAHDHEPAPEEGARGARRLGGGLSRRLACVGAR
jgi:hypothetical protein